LRRAEASEHEILQSGREVERAIFSQELSRLSEFRLYNNFWVRVLAGVIIPPHCSI